MDGMLAETEYDIAPWESVEFMAEALRNCEESGKIPPEKAEGLWTRFVKAAEAYAGALLSPEVAEEVLEECRKAAGSGCGDIAVAADALLGHVRFDENGNQRIDPEEFDGIYMALTAAALHEIDGKLLELQGADVPGPRPVRVWLGNDRDEVLLLSAGPERWRIAGWVIGSDTMDPELAAWCERHPSCCSLEGMRFVHFVLDLAEATRKGLPEAGRLVRERLVGLAFEAAAEEAERGGTGPETIPRLAPDGEGIVLTANTAPDEDPAETLSSIVGEMVAWYSGTESEESEEAEGLFEESLILAASFADGILTLWNVERFLEGAGRIVSDPEMVERLAAGLTSLCRFDEHGRQIVGVWQNLTDQTLEAKSISIV